MRPCATLCDPMRCPCTVFVLGRGAHVALVGELDLEVGEIVLEHLVLGLHELQLLLEVGQHLVRVRVSGQGYDFASRCVSTCMAGG